MQHLASFYVPTCESEFYKNISTFVAILFGISKRLIVTEKGERNAAVSASMLG